MSDLTPTQIADLARSRLARLPRIQAEQGAQLNGAGRRLVSRATVAAIATLRDLRLPTRPEPWEEEGVLDPRD